MRGAVPCRTDEKEATVSDQFDDQDVAEELDEDALDDRELEEYPADRGLASLEATVVTDTGDVPLDSVAERDWREEPEDDGRPSDRGRPVVELVDDDFADPTAEPTEDDEGELLGDAVDAEGMVSAEESAIPLVDEDDEGG